MKKFKLTGEAKTINGKKVFRIKALISFGNVKAGECGGYVEKEENLSQYGNSWISGDAMVYGNAEVYGDAWSSGDAMVYESAKVRDKAVVCGTSEVFGHADVYGNAEVSGNAKIFDNAFISDKARLSGDAEVFGDADIFGDAHISGEAKVYHKAKISGNAYVFGNAWISGYAWINGNAYIIRDTDFVVVEGFDTGYRVITFFKTKNKNVEVNCSFFCGSLSKFRQEVISLFNGTNESKEYIALANLVELKFH